ncbi:phage minor head protein, partial [Bombella sp. TMW 2.2559]
MAALRSPGKAITLPLGRTNAGIAAWYEKKLRILIRRMHRDTIQTVRTYYRRAEPELAQDENPVTALDIILEKLKKKWLRIFEDHASTLAEHFVKSCQNDCEGDLRRRLKRAGFGVTFKPNAAMQRKLKVAINYNVGKIKSIAEQYHDGVNTLVTNSVMKGGDIGALTKDLQARYGISERKAAFIAEDQNHKINQAVERMRDIELGLEKSKWRHCGGGRHPRPEHVKADGRIYETAKGCL